jgi:hypothetical protein
LQPDSGKLIGVWKKGSVNILAVTVQDNVKIVCGTISKIEAITL